MTYISGREEETNRQHLCEEQISFTHAMLRLWDDWYCQGLKGTPKLSEPKEQSD